MNLKLPGESKILSVLRAWYLVGIAGFAFPFTFELFRVLTPLSLLLLVTVFFLYHENRDRRLWIAMTVIFLAGYGIEVAGVITGRIFGEYEYGTTLGIRLFGVPLLIGINWVIMVYGGVALASLAGFGRVPGSLLAALIMTTSDFIIEKFAILSGMWSWQNSTPPLQNYISWFIISFIFCLLAYPSVSGMKRKVAMVGYLYQVAFFIIIVVIHELFWK